MKSTIPSHIPDTPGRSGARAGQLFAVTMLTALGAAGLIAAPAAAGSAALQRAHCTWNIAGEWSGDQSTGTVLGLDIVQHGEKIRGTAHEEAVPFDGSLKGEVAGSTVKFTVTWSPSLKGKYSGYILPRELVGVTHQIGAAGQQFEWNENGISVCIPSSTE